MGSEDAASTLPALLAAVLRGQPGDPGPEDMAGALGWVAASTGAPVAGMAQRLADRLAGGEDLASALRELAARGNEEARWAAVAVESHRELGGDLPALLGVADRVAAERAVVGRERASLRTESRLIVAALLAQPLLLAGVGALMTAGVGALDLLLLVLAVLLTAVGGWWLTRVTRPPFDWRPWRPGSHDEAEPADDLLDRAALAVGAGLGLDEAVRWAAGDRPADEAERVVEVLGARAAPAGNGEADPGPDRSVVGPLQDAATDVRRRQVAGTRAATQRIRWLAAIPYVACILPASALVLVALL